MIQIYSLEMLTEIVILSALLYEDLVTVNSFIMWNCNSGY